MTRCVLAKRFQTGKIECRLYFDGQKGSTKQKERKSKGVQYRGNAKVKERKGEGV